MKSFRIVYLVFLYRLECFFGIRPESLESHALVAGGRGNQSEDGILAVDHVGVFHRDRAAKQAVLTVVHSLQQKPPSRSGLLELLQGSQRVRPTAPVASLKPRDIGIFYGILYTVGLAIFVCFRFLEPVKINCSWLLRQVAMFYWRWSRLAPMGASCCLFLLADVLAVAAGKSEDHGQAIWKVALVLSTAVFNTVWHHVFYTWLDRKVEEGEGLLGRVKKVAIMLALHLGVYLPIAVPFFIILTDFLSLTLHDAATNCSTSALASIPRHLEASTTLAGDQVAASFGWSFLFWPGSNLINFTLIQAWAPGFKSTWDGIMTVLWNAYILALRSMEDSADDPVAVGPMLADRDALTPWRQYQEPAVDCKRSSAFSIGYFIAEMTWLTIKTIAEYSYYLAEYSYYLARWLTLNSKTQSYLFACYVKRRTWEAWCVNCYICRLLYMGTYTLSLYICSISWAIFMIPFRMFDAVKWYVGLFFVPRFFDYNNCPCPKAGAFDQSWTTPGVIYTGTLFYAK